MTNNDHRSTDGDEALIEELLKKKLQSYQPSDRARDALYGKLIRENFAAKPASQASFIDGLTALLHRFSTYTVAAVFVMVTSGLTSALAYTSPDVNRSSSLYFLKQFLEGIELKVSSDPAETYLKFSERRFEELERLKASGTIDEQTIADALEATTKATVEAENIVDETQQIEVQTKVVEHAQRQRVRLSNIMQEIVEEEPGQTEVLSTIEEKIEEIGAVELKTIEDISTKNPNWKAKDRDLQTDVTIGISSTTAFTAGNEGSINVRLVNEGNRRSRPFNLQILWGSESQNLEIESLGPNKIKTVNIPHTFPRVGWYTVTTIADPENRLPERTTANNRASRKVEVKPAPIEHECATEGEKRCAGTYVEECGLWSTAGQRSWKRTESCASNQECTEGACVDVPQCESTCENSGDLRCNGLAIEQCLPVDGGCMQWQATSTCSGDQSCEAGQCVSPEPVEAVCGNGEQEAGEACDDSNTIAGDGCEVDCTVTPISSLSQEFCLQNTAYYWDEETNLCTDSPTSCTDSDGGNTADVLGTTYGLVQNTRTRGVDVCIDASTLKEHACDGNALATAEVACEHGCSDGACLPPPETNCEATGTGAASGSGCTVSE